MATAQTMASHSTISMLRASKSRFHADWANTEPAMEGTRGFFMNQ
jgi:hypothetical protein